MSTPSGAIAHTAGVLGRLSLLDRFLPVWIFGAMGLGLLAGRLFPDLGELLNRVQVAGVSVPIAVGLLWMMYPVLAKVRYEAIGSHAGNPRLLGTSLLLNWVVGPVVMFALAWLLLPDLPALPERSDRRGARPVHRDGAGLEHARLRLRGAGGHSGRPQLRVSGPHLFGPGVLLPGDCARLVGCARHGAQRFHGRYREERIDLPRDTAAGRLRHPEGAGRPPRSGMVRDPVPAQDRPDGATGPAVHSRPDVRHAGRPHH